jgi:rhodanese-related sulfurtransferase
MDMKICSTLAYERESNAMLREDDEDGFVKQALAQLGPQPPNFKAIVELNKGALVTGGAEVPPLTPRQVEVKRSEGALLVDARTDLQFDEAHIPGAVCIPAVQAGFGTRLAWLADRDQAIVLIGRDDEDSRRAAKLALAVGIRKFGGYLSGGMTEWRRENREVQHVERVELEQLAERSESDAALQILDVREQSERDAGYIPGSLFKPWHDINGLPDGLDALRPVAVVCASGQRAAVAASLVQRYGAHNVIHVVGGGVPKWVELGRPIEQPGHSMASA